MAKLEKLYELIDKENFEPAEFSTEDMAEKAYLKAEYNSILLEMMMEA